MSANVMIEIESLIGRIERVRRQRMGVEDRQRELEMSVAQERTKHLSDLESLLDREIDL